ncbi:MAG: LysR family transcriptional regulator [Chromatiales bacterium]|nr:LysR family transcriptional regulator [Chromatiales bacterium]
MHAAVLRYFEAVAEEGSIRRASERLHISPSAVDRQILKLEDYFGTPLFERRPNGMRLTDAGQLVLRHSRDTLHDFARLRGDIDNLRGVISGRVTITTLDSLTVHFLPEAMARFVAAHPAVQIRVVALDPVETMHSVAQGHADLGLTFSPARRRGVSLLADVPSPMCAIMAPDHELAARSSLTLDECGAFRLLYQDHSGSMQPFFGAEMDAFKSAHHPLVVSNTLAVLKRLLLRGVGIAFYTRLGFTEELASGRLVAVPLEDERLSTLRLCLIAPSDRLPTVAAQAMAEHLRRALARFGSGLDGERGR